MLRVPALSTAETAAGPVKPTRKKPPAAGIGRKKGALNHTTRDVRVAVGMIAERNASKIDGWLARVARKNPAKAIDLYIKLIEYHIPKLSRQEIVKPPSGNGRVIDSSQLTAEQREQLRQMILGQAEPTQLEMIPANVLQPVGLCQAQVVESVGDSIEVRAAHTESQ